MTMPDPGAALHIATLDYYCTFGELQADTGPVTFACPDPVRFRFGFDTGAAPNPDGTITVTWDYSWFSQAATETAISGALDQICAAIGALLGLAQAEVQAVVAVQRIWTITPNVQGAGASTGQTALTSMMPYPAAALAGAGELGAVPVTG